MPLDFGGGISEGIQLGALGFEVGGPVGGAIGAGVGLVKGTLGGRGRRRQERRLRDRNEKLLSMLQANIDKLQSSSASDTQGFQQGRAALRETIGRQARADASAAAARGLTGSSFEIAQGGNRARALARGTGQLLVGSEAQLAADRRAALGRYLQGVNIANATDLSLQQSADQRAQQRGQAIGSAVEAGANAGLFGDPLFDLGSLFRRGGPGDAPFIDSIPLGVGDFEYA